MSSLRGGLYVLRQGRGAGCAGFWGGYAARMAVGALDS